MAREFRRPQSKNSHSGRRPYQGRRSNTQRSRGPKRQYIDPAKFIKAASPKEAESYTPTHAFADFALHPNLQRNLKAKGFVTPSPIQDQSIPSALEGKDVIGIASTGTGKTAAFALPMLHKIITQKGSKALIVAPTRELAQQIETECRSLGKGNKIYGALLIGGSSMGRQLSDLRYKPQIVIGTPGRIKDHIERKSLDLSQFNTIALDEVDRMLDMGFVNDVTYILEHTHPDRQSLFFSATMDNRVRTLIDKFSNDPVTISLKPSSTSDNVHQDVVRYKALEEKIDRLHDILISDTVTKVILFDETQRDVERLSKELINRGFDADAIHGGKTQGQRQRALRRFKQDEISILVATDVAARGIDVSDVTHVINYSIPQQYDDYIHRIGRAGRAGQIGYALTFVKH